MNQEEYQRRQRDRARVMGLLLVGFAILIFAISVAKIKLAV